MGPFPFLGLTLRWDALQINLALQLTLYCYLDHSGAGERRVAPRKGRRETLGTRLHSSINKGAYAIGRQDDEKMSRKIGNAQSRATFFRHSAVLSLPAVLLRKLPNGCHTANVYYVTINYPPSSDMFPRRFQVETRGLGMNTFQFFSTCHLITILSCRQSVKPFKVNLPEYYSYLCG